MLGSWGDFFEVPWPWDRQNHHVKYIESEHDSSIMINKYVINYWDILDLGSGWNEESCLFTSIYYFDKKIPKSG